MSYIFDLLCNENYGVITILDQNWSWTAIVDVPISFSLAFIAIMDQ